MTGLRLGIWVNLLITLIPIPRAEAGCKIQRISVKNNTLHMSRRMTKTITLTPIPRAEAGCKIQRISVKNNTLHMSRRMTKP